MNRITRTTLTAAVTLFAIVESGRAFAVMVELPANRDAAVNSASTGTNTGAQTQLGLGTGSRVLYNFDVSALDGTYTMIDAITLRVYVTVNQISDAGGNPGLDVFVHEILAANANWIEGNKAFASATSGEPTWNHRQHNTVSWAGSAGLSTAGTDYVSTSLSTINVPSSVIVGTAIDFDLTGDLTGLIDGWQTVNSGLLLFTTFVGGTDRIFVGTKENLDSGLHPSLFITYSFVPEPASGTILGSGLVLLCAMRKRRRRRPVA